MTRQDEFLLGVGRIWYMALGAIPFGMAFGALATQKGLSIGEVVLMSLIVFAGSAQIVSMEIWNDPIPVVTILTLTFLVNARHILMGAALAPALRSHHPLKVHIALYFMTDQSWALSMQRKSEAPLSLWFYLGLSIPLICVWSSSSYAGAMLGQLIADPKQWGLDFAVAAVFLTMLCGFWQGRKTSFLPWIMACIVAVGMYEIAGGAWYIISGALAAMITRAIVYKEGE